LDQATIDEPIYAAIEPCMAFIKRNIAMGSRIGEIYREDRWEYPLEAVREVIINAVVHRDYAIQGSDIKVAMTICWKLQAPALYRTTCRLMRSEQVDRKSGIEFWRPFSRN
jgi:hypothetical protein